MGVELEIGSVDTSDAVRVHEIYVMFRRANDHGFLGMPPFPPAIRGGRVEAAHWNNRIVGAVLWSQRKRDGAARLNTIAVQAMFRRRGAARALIERMCDLARVAGATEVLTSVIEANVPMRTLISRHGFAHLEMKQSTHQRIAIYRRELA